MKKAFTMLELVFVIVVIGILAAVIIPRTERNNVSEAAIELESQIRYAQHLAIIDDKFDANNSNWFRNLWQIHFNGNLYSIRHDNFKHNDNTIYQHTFARNPQDDSNISNIDLNKKYQVTIQPSGDCTGESIISFDHLGRPLIGDIRANVQPYVAGQLLQDNQNCSIVIKDDGNMESNATLRIHAETGYVERL